MRDATNVLSSFFSRESWQRAHGRLYNFHPQLKSLISTHHIHRLRRVCDVTAAGAALIMLIWHIIVINVSM